MINLSEVGAFPSIVPGGFQVHFGLYLPGIRATDGFDVVVRVIHKADRFDPAVPPVDFHLTWNSGHTLDLWSVDAPVSAGGAGNFGTAGTYLYRFQLWWKAAGAQPVLITRWFTDPFARRTDVGKLSAVDVSPSPVLWTDGAYRTPELDDLIVYELHASQFNDTLDGVVDRLVYLESLGVNCLELMPITSNKLDFDWGYGPLHYFSPSAHTGGPEALRRLVSAAHARNMAVILDVVYQHVDGDFAYKRVYDDVNNTLGTPKVTSPMIGGDGPFGPQVDFSKEFAQQYFAASNRYWLDEYHVDGFRYDEVTDLYVSPTDTGYSKLVYDTYNYSLPIPRFDAGIASYSRIIQCAEALGRAPEVLRNTYTSCAWQDDLLNTAEWIARGNAPSDGLAHTLDPFFNGRYPDKKTVVNTAGAAVDMPVAPFQYLNSHDHSHLIVFEGTSGSGLIPMGDRSKLWGLQPLAIALYTSQGIPMLWEGEEFADNYNLPGDGSARVNLRRDTHWEYFYDDFGVPLIRLYRKLAKLRRSVTALRSRESFYYYQQSLQGTEIVAYHRRAGSPENYAMVILNFADGPGTIKLPFPKSGTWTERLDDDIRAVPFTLTIANAGDTASITVPSNYGLIFTL